MRGSKIPFSVLKHKGIPYLILASMVLLAPLAFGSVSLWGRALLHAHIWILLAWFFFQKEEQVVLPPLPVILPAYLFLFLGLMSCAYSSYPFETLRRFSDLFLGCIFFILLLNIFRSGEGGLRIFTWVVGVGCLVALMAYARDLLDIAPSDRAGLKGPYVNRNHFGGLMEIVFPVTLCFAIFGARKKENRKRVVLCAVVAVFLGFSLMGSLSRAGILSCFLALILSGVLYSLRSGNKRESFVFLGVVFFVLFGFVFFQLDRFQSFAAAFFEKRMYYRLDIWSLTARLIQDAPFFGHGLGTFGWESLAYRQPGIIHHLRYAHNEYLHFAAELGLIASLLFAFVVWFVPVYLICQIKPHHRSRVKASLMGCSIAWFSLAIHAFFDFNHHIPANMVFALLVLAGALLVSGEPGVIWSWKKMSTSKFQKAAFLVVGLGLILSGLTLFGEASYLIGNDQVRKEQDATRSYQRAVWLNPTVAEYHYALGGEWIRQKKFEEAKKSFQRAQWLNRKMSASYFHLAQLYEQDKKYQQAIDILRSGIAIDPLEPRKQVDLVRLFVRTGDREMAVFQCRELLELNRVRGFQCVETLGRAGVSHLVLAKILPRDLAVYRMFISYLHQAHQKEFLGQWLVSLSDGFSSPQEFDFLTKHLLSQGFLVRSNDFLDQGLKRFPEYKPLVARKVQVAEALEKRNL